MGAKAIIQERFFVENWVQVIDFKDLSRQSDGKRGARSSSALLPPRKTVAP